MKRGENTIIPYPKLPHVHWCISEIVFRNLHFHSNMELTFVLDGDASICCGEQIIDAVKGDLFVFNAYDSHEIRSKGNPTILLSMQLSYSFCHEYFPEFQNIFFTSNYISQYYTHEEKARLIKLLVDSTKAYCNSSDGFNFACVSGAALIIESLLRNAPHEQLSSNEIAARMQVGEYMERISNYINANLAEDALLKKLSTYIGFTPTYMSHYFKKHFLITFQQYLMRQRIEKALQMLETTDMPILDICICSGFADYRQLNKYCRNKFGMSAHEYRSNNIIRDKSYPSPTPMHPQMIQYLFTDEESEKYLSDYIQNMETECN